MVSWHMRLKTSTQRRGKGSTASSCEAACAAGRSILRSILEEPRIFKRATDANQDPLDETTVSLNSDPLSLNLQVGVGPCTTARQSTMFSNAPSRHGASLAGKSHDLLGDFIYRLMQKKKSSPDFQGQQCKKSLHVMRPF